MKESRRKCYRQDSKEETRPHRSSRDRAAMYESTEDQPGSPTGVASRLATSCRALAFNRFKARVEFPPALDALHTVPFHRDFFHPDAHPSTPIAPGQVVFLVVERFIAQEKSQ